jgi:uncharacterized protein
MHTQRPRSLAAGYLPAVILSVRAHPGAARERLEWDGELLHAWVTAPAVDGRANRAVVLAVARWIGVAPARVRVLSGARGRSKLLEVDGDPDLPPPSTGAYQTR